MRIASLSVFSGHGKKDGYSVALRQASQLILEAGRSAPDLIVLPELFAHAAGAPAEGLRGLVVSRLSKLARKLGCLIVCPVLERDPATGTVYNSVVFLSARGQPLATYRKCRPTESEVAGGTTPGNMTVVADTPWGRLGVLICFDLNFIELFAALRAARPQMLFFCSMFRGGLRLRYLALECACYVVSSVASSPESTCQQVINPLGRVVSESGSALQESFSRFPPYLEENINLNYGVFHIDGNSNHLQRLRNRYAGRLRLEVAQAEGVFLLESLDPKLAIDSVRQEFRLVPSLDYFDAARRFAGNDNRLQGNDKIAGR